MTWERRHEGTRAGRFPAVAIASGGRGPKRDADDGRDRVGPFHRAASRRVDCSQSLAKRSFQARAVRATSSEKPVKR